MVIWSAIWSSCQHAPAKLAERSCWASLTIAILLTLDWTSFDPPRSLLIIVGQKCADQIRVKFPALVSMPHQSWRSEADRNEQCWSELTIRTEVWEPTAVKSKFTKNISFHLSIKQFMGKCKILTRQLCSVGSADRVETLSRSRRTMTSFAGHPLATDYAIL